jgi:DNA-binding XRE family transcriptional regulator
MQQRPVAPVRGNAALAESGDVRPGPVLTRALVRAGKELGLTQADLGQVVGRDRTALSRGAIEPGTKSGELALLLIRAYRALYVLVGGEPRQMKHWMHTHNRHVGGVPAHLVRSVAGLMRVVEYLDAIRGRV